MLSWMYNVPLPPGTSSQPTGPATSQSPTDTTDVPTGPTNTAGDAPVAPPGAQSPVPIKSGVTLYVPPAGSPQSPPQPAPWWRSPWTWGGVGLAAVGVAGVVVALKPRGAMAGLGRAFRRARRRW